MYYRILMLALVLLMGGCATPANHFDPLESVNRPIYKFNTTADAYVMRPIAKGYDTVTPVFIKKGVHNFFNNLDDIFVFSNDFLQGKFKQGSSDVGRLAVNSTIGLVGLFDVASDMGMPKHDEDFGQTLGYWGLGSGPYLVVPFLGPSSLRDSSNIVLEDFVLNPIDLIHKIPVRNAVTALHFIDARAQLLTVDSVADDSFDPYSFMRDAWLQSRYNRVYDGNPPKPLFPDDDDDSATPPAAAPATPGGKTSAPPAAPDKLAPDTKPGASLAPPLSVPVAAAAPDTGSEMTPSATASASDSVTTTTAVTPSVATNAQTQYGVTP